MARLDVFEFRGYYNLLLHEYQAIKEFMTGNPQELAGLIKSGDFMSEGMRIVIADLLEGKLKRKKGDRGNTMERDFKIYDRITTLLSEGHNLTSDFSDPEEKPGAARIVAKEFEENFKPKKPKQKYLELSKQALEDRNEQKCLKAYYRIKKAYSEYDEALRTES